MSWDGNGSEVPVDVQVEVLRPVELPPEASKAFQSAQEEAFRRGWSWSCYRGTAYWMNAARRIVAEQAADGRWTVKGSYDPLDELAALRFALDHDADKTEEVPRSNDAAVIADLRTALELVKEERDKCRIKLVILRSGIDKQFGPPPVVEGDRDAGRQVLISGAASAIRMMQTELAEAKAQLKAANRRADDLVDEVGRLRDRAGQIDNLRDRIDCALGLDRGNTDDHRIEEARNQWSRADIYRQNCARLAGMLSEALETKEVERG